MRKPPMSVELFKARRRQVGQLIPGGALVLPAWPEYYRNADNHHAYRVESNLFYMTGFDEPEACLILRPGKTPESVLFVRPKNPERETWDGFRYGLDGAREAFAVDQTYPIQDFERVAPGLLQGFDKIHYPLFRNKEFDEIFSRVIINISGWRPKYGLGLPTIEDAYALVGDMRIRKGEDEIEAMRKVCAITSEAHIEMMKATRPGANERALHGLFIKAIMERGAYGEAYGGIVATGDNATTLHYRFNESTLQDGQLILVDCGAEYLYYSGDITRTYPVNGKFSPVQKRVYEKLLSLQRELIGMVKPGTPHAGLQKRTIEGVCEILITEKILKGSVEENVRSGAYTKYYPHGVSHLLGLDTHDAGALLLKGHPRPLEAGWVLTVEPGLYFPANDTTLPDDYRGIGIRIEDDVLVTPDGHDVLTKAAPKSVDEMEAIIGANYR